MSLSVQTPNFPKPVTPKTDLSPVKNSSTDDRIEIVQEKTPLQQEPSQQKIKEKKISKLFFSKVCTAIIGVAAIYS